VNDSTIYIIENDKQLDYYYYSNDYGLHWNVGGTGTILISAPVQKVRFFGTDSAYILAGYELYKSTDRLNSVRKISSAGNNIKLFFFTSVDTGYIVTYTGEIMRTNDGGTSWQRTASVFDDDGDAQYKYQDIYCLNSQECWLSTFKSARGKAYMLKTNNAGGTYTGMNEPNMIGVNTTLLYPNPVKNELYIKPSAIASKQVTLYTMQGQELISFQLDNNERILDISTIPNGIYEVSITLTDGSRTKHKLMVAH